MAENLNTYEPEISFNDNDWDVFTKWIKGVLTTSVTTVTFTKKDGTERVMKCTLRPDLLPQQEIKEDKAPRKQNDATMSVYDIEANGWRSFTIRSVKRVSFTIT